jgi:hypothetical protein
MSYYIEDLCDKKLNELREIAETTKSYKNKKTTKKELISIILDVKQEDCCKMFKDIYTEEILKKRFYQHKDYVLSTKKIIDETGLNIRLPNTPEDISENTAKFIIRSWVNDPTTKWSKSSKLNIKISGDLISLIEGIQEVKCFTSTGPLSFGPKEAWNVVYFLDFVNWLDNKIILWRVNLSNTSDEWKSIKVNKNQTFDNQAEQGRRPRSGWEDIKKQLNEKHYEKVFDGSFEDIFKPSNELSSV